MATRVFISHSRGDQLADALVVALEPALRAAGYDPLVDANLLAGQTWRRELCTWMGLSHAALVVLSDAAFRDDKAWVFWETAIFCWRRALEPKFPIIPVLLPGVTNQRLREDPRFRELQLPENQSIRMGDCVEDAGSVAADVVHALAGQLSVDAQPTSTPYDEAAKRIEAQLAAMQDSGALEEIAAKYGLDLGYWSPVDQRRRRFALGLLHVTFDKAIDALHDLIERTPEPAAMLRAYEVLEPNWVDLRAASAIAVAGHGAGQSPAVVLNATKEWTARQFVKRACARTHGAWRVVKVQEATGENAAAETERFILDALRREYADSLSLRGDDFGFGAQVDADHEVRELVERFAKDGLRTVILMRFPGRDAALSRTLTAAFPSAIFLFVCGQTPIEEDMVPRDVIRSVRPPLQWGEENKAYEQAQSAREKLRA